VECSGDTACLAATVVAQADLNLKCGDKKNGCRNMDVSCPNTKSFARTCDGEIDSPLASAVEILEVAAEDGSSDDDDGDNARRLQADVEQVVHRRRLLDAIEEPSKLVDIEILALILPLIPSRMAHSGTRTLVCTKVCTHF
jgi:hypothetical protein